MTNLNSIKLKVKALSLAEEAKIIRRLEKGCTNQYGFNPIQDHRLGIVRNESRATHLARAFLSGKAYKTVEPSRKVEKEAHFYRIQKRLISMVKKYGFSDTGAESAVKEWLNE